MQDEISLDQFNTARTQMIGAAPPAAKSGAPAKQESPNWLKPDQQKELNAFTRSKAYTPRAHTDMVGNFARENGRQWTPQLEAAQLKAQTAWSQANKGGASDASGMAMFDPNSDLTLEQFYQAQKGTTADPATPAEEAPGFFDDPLGYLSGSTRTEFPNLDELNAFDMSAGQGALYQGATSLAFDDQGKQGILGTILGDQKPEFTTDKFGNSVVTFGAGDNEGKSFYINKPGFSGQDASTLGANIAMTAIPGGLAGRTAAQAGMGALRVGAATGGGAAVGELTRQVSGNLLGDETRKSNLVPGVDLVDLGLSAVPEAVMAGRAFSKSSNLLPPGTPANTADVIRETGALSERTGVPFFRGQTVNTPAASGQSAVVAESRNTSLPFKGALAEQTDKVRALADEIATVPSSPTGVLLETRAKDAGVSVIDNAKNTRKGVGDPAYAAALDNKPPMDTSNIVKNLEGMRGDVAAGTPFSTKLEGTIKILKADDNWLLNPRQVQSVKVSVSDAIKSAQKNGDNNLARQLISVESEIQTFLENGTQGLKQADDLWKQFSAPIKELDNSAIGELAKLDGFGLPQFTKKLFGVDSALAEQRAFIKQNLDQVDPTLYSDLARKEMERRLSLIRSTETGGGARNVPQQINDALFPNDASFKMWDEALPGAGNALADLRDVLNISARTRSLNSTTALKTEVRQGATSALDNANPTLWGRVEQMVTYMAKKAVKPIGEARTDAKRLGLLDEEINVDYNKLADEFVENIGGPNTKAGIAARSFAQSFKQFMGSDEMPPEEEADTSMGVLAQ